jgi:membrane associated rhomboid family serine protease
LLPLKDIIRPRRTPLVSRIVLAAAVTAFLALAIGGALDRTAATFLALDVLYLIVFADNVEDRLGRGGLIAILVVSLAAGVVATLQSNAQAPLLFRAASPAVAGVVAAYLVLYPGSRVLFWAPVPHDLHELPALFVAAVFAIMHVGAGGAALGAAAAGAAAGAGLCAALKRPFAW